MQSTINKICLSAVVPESHRGRRLDQVAAELFADFSRSRLQQWIRDGVLRVEGQPSQVRYKVRGGETLQLEAESEEQGEWVAQALDLDIVYEDQCLLVINKTADFVVHPAAGNREGTVLNALLDHCPDLRMLPRGGIVHRLDKDTTGLMVVAKTLSAHNQLVRQLQQRTVSRKYEAIVNGVMTGGGIVDAPIGRHPRQRKKMAVVNGGKEARTHYRVLHRFDAHTYVGLSLETGRTHQIRVHMAHIQHPLVGDSIYAGRLRIPAGATPELQAALRNFGRQALHARELGLVHPESGDEMRWTTDLPADMRGLLKLLGVSE